MSKSRDYEDIIFRYKNGVLRPMKTTNEYMNNKIKGDAKKQFQLSNKNIEKLIRTSINEREDNYALNYITKMSPDDFLKLTAGAETMERLEREKFTLDLDILNREGSWIYLDIDFGSNEVISHEGRHRMYALKEAGYKKADVVIYPRNYDKYDAKEYNFRKIKSQEEVGNNFVVFDKLVPVSKANIDRIKRRNY